MNKMNPIGDMWVKKFLHNQPGRNTFTTREVFNWVVDNEGPTLANTAIWKWLQKYGCKVTEYSEAYVRNALKKGS